MTAITAITAQNTTGVKSIVSINSQDILNQIIFTSRDIKPDAIKIGMLHSSKVINSVINALNKIKISKIILDPVMIAKNGARLIDNKAINILKNKLIKKVSLITPNIPEAEVLIGNPIFNKKDMIKTAKIILNMGSKYMLLKGGHLKNRMIFDILVTKKRIKIYSKRKIRTRNTHGTGCTLSSALATCLSQKKNIFK